MGLCSLVSSSIGCVVAATVLVAPAYAEDQDSSPLHGPGVGTARLSFRAEAWPDQTGTIVYVRGDDVWIARPDGADARRLTSDGTADEPYSSPSEDDAGHVVAIHGNGSDSTLVRMDQHGRVLQSFVPPVPSLSIGSAAVSPDGDTIAYGALFSHADCSTGSCHTDFDHQLHFTAATSATARYGTIEDVTHASWMTDRRLVLETSAGNVVGIDDVGDPETTWFEDCTSGVDGCDDTTVDHYTPTEARAGDRYASAMEVLPWSGDPAQYLLVLQTHDATTGTPPAAPGSVGCTLQGPPLTTTFPGPDEMAVYDPSWSPDGKALVVAFQDPETGWSVYRVEVPDLADCTTVTGGLLLEGASQPAWSSAELDTTPSRLRFTGTRPAIVGKRHVGRTLSLSRRSDELLRSFAPRATSVSYHWLRDGRVIRRATHAIYRVVRADRHHRLSCRVTGHRSGLLPASVTTRRTRIR
jgi:hypothetical protein